MQANLPAQISLEQFEIIDAAYGRLMRADPAEDARFESRLFAELVGLLGYTAANEIADVREYAARLIADCLTGKMDVDDGEFEADWDGFDGWGVDPETGRGEWVA